MAGVEMKQASQFKHFLFFHLMVRGKVSSTYLTNYILALTAFCSNLLTQKIINTGIGQKQTLARTDFLGI